MHNPKESNMHVSTGDGEGYKIAIKLRPKIGHVGTILQVFFQIKTINECRTYSRDSISKLMPMVKSRSKETEHGESPPSSLIFSLTA